MKLEEKFKDTPVIGKFVSNPKLMELFRFAVAGVAGFIVDYLIYLIVIWIFGDGAYLWGKILGFAISVLVNYVMCLYYVFEDAKKQSPAQIVVFFGSSVVGLGLNALLIWIAVDLLGIPAWIANLPVVLIVMVWNYIMKRIAIYKMAGIGKKEK